MAKTKNKRPGKPRGMNYADMLARRKAINAVKLDAAALLLTEQAMQRALWLTVCSLSDAYGFGKERLDRFFEAYQRNSDELQVMTMRSKSCVSARKRCLGATSNTYTTIFEPDGTL